MTPAFGFGPIEVEHYLARLAGMARDQAPRECCPHQAEPCLSCALDWFVAQRVPVNLDPGFLAAAAQRTATTDISSNFGN